MRASARNSRRPTLRAASIAKGYKQVERSLGDMQSQIARLNQDLSFYRGLVQPDSLVHVKVQQMQIVPGRRRARRAPWQYRLKFVLDADRQAGQRRGRQRRDRRRRPAARQAASA